MGSYGKIIGIGLAVIAIIVASLGIYYHFYGEPTEKPFSSEPPTTKPPAPPDEKRFSEKEVPYLYIPLLKESDEWFRKRIQDFWSYPKLAEWLKVKDLVRRITAAVDNIADGQSPRPHLKFLAPEKGFTIVKKGGKLYLNPQSYRRYDLVADAFASLNAPEGVRVFREIKPLFQEAYRELGYPNEDFQDTLVRAIKELLGTPTVEGDIALDQGMVTYEMADEELEDLSNAQKHLLRMGPQNIRKIQSKLREIALALGVPEKQLPKPKISKDF